MSRLALIAMIAIGAALPFALAVALDGGPAAFLSHKPLLAFAVVTVALILASCATEISLGPGLREDRANRWVLPAFGALGIAIALLPAWCDRADLLTIHGEAVRWLGVALYAIGGWLRLWPVFVLGRRFSPLVAIQPGHTLIVTGPYRHIRHPSYVGFIVISLGWSLAFRSLIGLLLTVLLLIPLIARIRAEEAFLASEFGAEYDAYRARTARLVPLIW